MAQSIPWVKIITEALGIMGILCYILAFQCKKHFWIVTTRTIGEFAYAVQMVLLGAYTAVAMNMIGVVRNVIFTRQVKNGKKTLKTGLVFSGILVAAGILTWDGPKSLLAISAKIASTVAYGSKNLTRLRVVCLCTSVTWITYNLIIGSWAGAVGDSFAAISSASGILRFDILPKLRAQKAKRNAGI